MNDAVATTVYRNTGIQKVTSITRCDAKQVEDRKLLANWASVEPIASINGALHILVLFAIEDGGRLGAHALALLKASATIVLDKGRRPRPCCLKSYFGLHVGPTVAKADFHVVAPRHLQACHEAHVP